MPSHGQSPLGLNHATIQPCHEGGGIGGRCGNVTIDGCVNYGKISTGESVGAIVGLIIEPSKLNNNAYLETSCNDIYGRKGYAPKLANNKTMTKREMQQQSFLDGLNANAAKLGASFSKWKFGNDGFPTLDWLDEMIAASIEQITLDRKNSPMEMYSHIYNMNGQIVRYNSSNTDGLPCGIYIVNGKKIAVTY
jgi:hypothetical protein